MKVRTTTTSVIILKNKVGGRAFTPHLVKPRSLERGWMCGKFIISYFRKPHPLSRTRLVRDLGRGAGFTLIELLFVIAILGILIGVSLPNFKKTFHNLQLNSFAGELQAAINYLHQRSIVEGKIIYLNIDAENKEYWSQIKDSPARLNAYHIPEAIDLETDQKEILFYPDGQIDKVTITLINPDHQQIYLTTKGVFGGAKILSAQ